MEELLLPHDVTGYQILETLDVKTLLIKFKSVSKQWRSTTRTPSFKEKQLIHHGSQSQPRDPLVLLVSLYAPSAHQPDPRFEAMRTLVVQSSLSVQIPTPWEDKTYDVCNTSCDGLICLYEFFRLPSIVVNPTTRWHRTIPRCNYQLVAAEKRERRVVLKSRTLLLDLVKTKSVAHTSMFGCITQTAELGLNDEATTCKVFDFATNAWRYLVPSSPHLILHTQAPVYVDGSLYWFTAFSQEGETMVLSLDLHTETFQVVTKAPFLHVSDEFKIVMCNLKGRLCVSEEKWPNQVIWSLDDSDHKTWKKMFSIDLTITSSLFPWHIKALAPLAVLDKDKLLFYNRESRVALVTHDPKTKSYDFAYTSKLAACGGACYFPSLVSIL